MNHVSRQGMMSIKLKLRILMLISVMTLCISIGVTAVGFDAVHRTQSAARVGDMQVRGLMEIKASAFATVLDDQANRLHAEMGAFKL